MGAEEDQYVGEIDAYFSVRKDVLIAIPPQWEDFIHEVGSAVKFPIVFNGAMVAGNLVEVTAYNVNPPQFKINLFYMCAIISRLDYDSHKRHTNHLPWPAGVPAQVAGPHFHAWPHNKRCADPKAHWKLKTAVPLPSNIKTFDAAFRWFCDQNNINQPAPSVDLPHIGRLL